MTTIKKTRILATSRDVVATATDAHLALVNFPEAVAAPIPPPYPTSLFNALLDSWVLKSDLDGLRKAADDPRRMVKRGDGAQSRPTGDDARRMSFKIGTKLVIKIEKDADDSRPLIFDKFSLQALAESDSERYQLHETFEENVLFLFGRRPRIWTMQGIVVNGRRAPDPVPNETDKQRQRRLSLDMDWANRLLMAWDRDYRGTRAIESKSRTYLAYDDSVIEATLLELTMARNAQVPTAVNATLTFVVHQRSFIGQVEVEGETTATLAELIAKTNSGRAFDSKFTPPTLEAEDSPPSEIGRRASAAESAATRAQEKEDLASEDVRVQDQVRSDAELRLDELLLERTYLEEQKAQAEYQLSSLPPGSSQERHDAEARLDEINSSLAKNASASTATNSSLADINATVDESKRRLVELESSDVNSSSAKTSNSEALRASSGAVATSASDFDLAQAHVDKNLPAGAVIDSVYQTEGGALIVKYHITSFDRSIEGTTMVTSS